MSDNRRTSALVAAAERVNDIYEGLRTDANDGTFALWSEDDLVRALHELGDALAEFRKSE